MTSEDVKKVTFERGMRGYRTEDVDDFLAKITQAMDDLARERDDAVVAQQETESKMYILAQKVEEYRGQEDTLKTTLINAQRMGETVVHEAKQKANALLRDASGKAELLRQQAETEIMNEQKTLERLQTEVTRFKATILNLYKQHIESLSALDTPVVRVADFLKEVGFEKPIEPLEEDAGFEEAVAGEEMDEEQAVEEATEVYVSLDRTENAAAPAEPGLFEGVPVDSNLP